MVNKKEQELKLVWREYWYRWEYIYIRHKKVASFIDSVIEDYSLSSVLNIWCWCWIMEQFIESHIELDWFDMDKNAISIATNLARKYSKDYNYSVQNIYDVNLSKKYDLIILSEVIEHIENEDQFINYVRKFLSEKWLILITVPNKYQPRNIFRKIFGLKLITMDKTHYREYSYKQIVNLLKDKLWFQIVKEDKAVLYLPFENFFKKFIKEDSNIRTRILKLFPKIASHLIFIVK